MRDRLDLELVDVDALSEIRLTADLMIAASESRRRLSQLAIDLVLGLGARPGEAATSGQMCRGRASA